MQYLCVRHQTILASDREQAAALWQGAMSNGGVARRDGNLALARSFYGTAFEIAVLHVHQQGLGDCFFDRNKLVAAGSCFIEVLSVLGIREEAETCYGLLRDYLMIAIGDASLPEGDRNQAINTLRELSTQHCISESNDICLRSTSSAVH